MLHALRRAGALTALFAIFVTFSVVAGTQAAHAITVTPAGTVSTLAGDGTAGFTGDTGPATDAELATPKDVAVDAAGNTYIADKDNHRIRMIDNAGQISTLAGDGTLCSDAGACGDGGNAIAAHINPQALAVDTANQKLYFIDEVDGGDVADCTGVCYQRVRVIDLALPTPTVAAYAGGGTQPFTDGMTATDLSFDNTLSDLALAPNGDLYVAEYATAIDLVAHGATPTISRYAGCFAACDTGAGHPAAGSVVGQSVAIAADGTVYTDQVLPSSTSYQSDIVSFGNDVDHTTALVAGGGSASCTDSTDTCGDGGPATSSVVQVATGMFLDQAGNFYFVDNGVKLRKVDASSAKIDTLAGNGFADWVDGAPAQASFNGAQGAALDNSGNVLIADVYNNRLRSVANVAEVTGGPGTVTVTVTPIAHTVVTSAPLGITCGGAATDCVERIPSGASFTLTATTSGGYGFAGWTGDAACGTDAACTIAPTSDEVLGGTITDIPPTATLDPPFAVWTGFSAHFSEPVHNVTTSNFVVRLAGATSNMANTTLYCSDANDNYNAVNCLTGNVTDAYLQNAASLVPGQSYVGFLEPAGVVSQIVDAGNNPLPAYTQNYVGDLHQEEDSYAGKVRWRSVSTSSAIGSSYFMEHRLHAEAFKTFSGSSVTLYTVRGPSFGKATVWIDGRHWTINDYSSSTTYHVAHTFTGLGSGVHNLFVDVLAQKGSTHGTGTSIAVDSIKAGTHSYSPDGFWWPTAFSGSHSWISTDLGGSSYSMPFHGVAISVNTLTGKSFGKAQIFIDGTLKSTIDTYASSTHFGVAHHVTGLTRATHVVKIVVLGTHRSVATGSLFALDSLDVTP